ncbi:MAG: flagellar motor switch protein FliN [Armatimonadota bacterium]
MSNEPLSQEEIDALAAQLSQAGEAQDVQPDQVTGEQAANPPSADVSETEDHPTIRTVEFDSLQGSASPTPRAGMDLIMDVNLQVTVELGRTMLKVRDVLALGPGAVVELDRHAGEPVDVVVNNKLIARGEVVVVDENFGVRITEIIDRGEEKYARKKAA